MSKTDDYVVELECPKCGNHNKDKGEVINANPLIYIYKCLKCGTSIHVIYDETTGKLQHMWKFRSGTRFYIGDAVQYQTDEGYCTGLLLSWDADYSLVYHCSMEEIDKLKDKGSLGVIPITTLKRMRESGGLFVDVQTEECNLVLVASESLYKG